MCPSSKNSLFLSVLSPGYLHFSVFYRKISIITGNISFLSKIMTEKHKYTCIVILQRNALPVLSCCSYHLLNNISICLFVRCLHNYSLNMRGSRQFCQRGPNYDNDFCLLSFVHEGSRTERIQYHYMRSIIGPPGKRH